MRLFTGTNSLNAGNTSMAQPADPFKEFLNSTMSSGAALFAQMAGTWLPVCVDTGDYVTLRAEVILEYERTILELRTQLLHYKRLVAQVIQGPGLHEEYAESKPVVPVDAASIRIVNSILAARVSPDAAFVDFEEGEL